MEVGSDRRRTKRTEVEGTAVMWCDGATAKRYHVADISLGGCQLRDGPLRPVGETCATVISIADGRRLTVSARVVRRFEGADGTTGMGLAFTQDSRHTAASLPELAPTRDGEESLSQTDCVLVVHAHRDTRKRLTGALERLGYDVIAVASPFEAIWALEHQGARIRAVLVSARLESTDPNDLLRFVARRHPRVKRVLMQTYPGDCPANDVHPEVDHVVPDEPWDVWSLFSEFG
ncbi:MAG: PilZ domain-containing protein [Myxococcales bacterium]|nr:PilZ domain-containing protein [Myxococcales bacterium]